MFTCYDVNVETTTKRLMYRARCTNRVTVSEMCTLQIGRAGHFSFESSNASGSVENVLIAVY